MWDDETEKKWEENTYERQNWLDGGKRDGAER